MVRSGAAGVAFETVPCDCLRVTLARRAIARAWERTSTSATGGTSCSAFGFAGATPSISTAPRAPGPQPKSGGGPHRAIAEDRGQERLARADAKADGLAEAAAVLVSTIGGERFSMTLTGVPSTPDGNAVVESPSFVTRAPVPPDEKTI